MSLPMEPFTDEHVLAELGAWQLRPIMPIHIVSSDAKPGRQVLAEKASTQQWPVGLQVVQILQRQLNRERAYVYLPNTGLVSNTTVAAQGVETDPAANAAIANIPAASLSPNVAYTVSGTVYLDGTLTTTDEDNFRLVANGGTVLTTILCPVESSDTGGVLAPVGPYTFTMGSTAQQISVQAKVAASGASAVYHAEIFANPLAGQISSVYFSPNIAQLQTVTPGGVLLNSQGQGFEWRSQRALYAIASLAGPTYVNVIDYLYDAVTENEGE